MTLLLFLLLLVFFWSAILGGRVLLPTDLIFDLDPLWQPLAPEGYTQPANRILSDQVYAFFPWRTFILHSLRQSRLPLWNPYINGGQPFLGNAQPAVFSPFNLVSYPLPLNLSYVVAAFLQLFVAGVFTFFFAREIGVSKPGAMLATVAFTFSGPMTVWLGYPLSSVVVWLPAMLWTIDRALTRRNWLYAILSGLAVTAQFLGGHPETSFHVMLAWAAYALYRAVSLDGWQPAALFPQLLRIAAAGIGGVMLASVQLLPFAEALLQSPILAARQARAAGRSLSLPNHLLLEWHEWPTVITTILPQYFGTPLDKSYLYPYSNYVEQNAYTGILPLTLAAAVALHHARHRSSPYRGPVLFFALMAGLCLGIAIRLPLLNAINYLPILNISASGRMRLIYAFAVAVLAGWGLDEISTGRQDCRRIALRILVVLALASLILIALAYVGFVAFQDEIIRFGRAFAESQWGTPYYSHPLEYYYAQVDEKHAKRLASFLPSNVVMYLPVLIASAWLVLDRWCRKPRSEKVWTCAVLGLTILDLFCVGMPFNPTIAPEHVFPTPDAIQFLRQDSDIYRVTGTGLILYPNSGMVFGISDIRGYDAVVPRRYANLIDRVEGHFRHGLNSLFVRVDSPVLDLLNVKYALTDQDPGGRWELAYPGTGSVDVYRNRDVLPRAFVVYRADVVGGAAQSLERVLDRTFDFRSAVVLEQIPRDWTESPDEKKTPATVRIIHYEPDRVSIKVETAADGLLVLTDTYMPGWKALLDGQATPVYVANHAFRAIVVPAGVHQVQFLYKPLAFEIGLGISLLSCVSVACAIVWLLLVGRRSTRGGK